MLCDLIAQIPVDEVGGSSMGAIIGGESAMGWPWDRVYDHNRKAWKDARLRLEITFPTVSLLSGRRSRKMFDQTFGQHGIEEFRLPFFCTSVDLSTFRLAVHREGPRLNGSAPVPVHQGCGHRSWTRADTSTSTAVN